MFRIGWRLQRIGVIGMTAFGVLYGLLQVAIYKSAAGSTAAQHLAFGHQFEVLGRSMTFLLPMPVRLDTIGGFLQWRAYGALPILFVFWASVLASNGLRAEEERGMLEQWRSAGVGVIRHVASRFAVFGLAALVGVGITSAAIAIASDRIAGSALDTVAVVQISVALFAVTMAGYSIGMVASQFTASRSQAAGVAGVAMLAVFFINSFARSIDNLRSLASVVSPFYYYDRSTPLTPGGSFDRLGTAGLLVVAIGLAAAAAWLMRRRDLGSSIFSRRSGEEKMTARPSRNPLLRLPVAAELYEQRMTILGWAVGTAIAGHFAGAAGRTLVDFLVNGTPAFKGYLSVIGRGDPYVGFTGYMWFSFFLVFLSVFAITQVARWSADDDEGRLETLLSAPVSRTRVVLVRTAAFIVSVAVIIAVSSLAFYAGAHRSGVSMQAGNLATASLPLIPFALSFAAAGALLASRVPRAAAAVLLTLSFLSFLVTLVGPLMKWPESVMRLSVYTLYGQPLTSGVDWTGLLILVTICVVGFGLAVPLMQRREVGA